MSLERLAGVFPEHASEHSIIALAHRNVTWDCSGDHAKAAATAWAEAEAEARKLLDRVAVGAQASLRAHTRSQSGSTVSADSVDALDILCDFQRRTAAFASTVADAAPHDLQRALERGAESRDIEMPNDAKVKPSGLSTEASAAAKRDAPPMFQKCKTWHVYAADVVRGMEKAQTQRPELFRGLPHSIPPHRVCVALIGCATMTFTTFTTILQAAGAAARAAGAAPGSGGRFSARAAYLEETLGYRHGALRRLLFPLLLYLCGMSDQAWVAEALLPQLMSLIRCFRAAVFGVGNNGMDASLHGEKAFARSLFGSESLKFQQQRDGEDREREEPLAINCAIVDIAALGDIETTVARIRHALAVQEKRLTAAAKARAGLEGVDAASRENKVVDYILTTARGERRGSRHSGLASRLDEDATSEQKIETEVRESKYNESETVLRGALDRGGRDPRWTENVEEEEILVGDSVRFRASIFAPRFGWGGVTREMVGIVKTLDKVQSAASAKPSAGENSFESASAGVGGARLTAANETLGNGSSNDGENALAAEIMAAPSLLTSLSSSLAETGARASSESAAAVTTAATTTTSSVAIAAMSAPEQEGAGVQMRETAAVEAAGTSATEAATRTVAGAPSEPEAGTSEHMGQREETLCIVEFMAEGGGEPIKLTVVAPELEVVKRGPESEKRHKKHREETRLRELLSASTLPPLHDTYRTMIMLAARMATTLARGKAPDRLEQQLEPWLNSALFAQGLDMGIGVAGDAGVESEKRSAENGDTERKAFLREIANTDGVGGSVAAPVASSRAEALFSWLTQNVYYMRRWKIGAGTSAVKYPRAELPYMAALLKHTGLWREARALVMRLESMNEVGETKTELVASHGLQRVWKALIDFRMDLRKQKSEINVLRDEHEKALTQLSTTADSSAKKESGEEQAAGKKAGSTNMGVGKASSGVGDHNVSVGNLGVATTLKRLIHHSVWTRGAKSFTAVLESAEARARLLIDLSPAQTLNPPVRAKSAMEQEMSDGTRKSFKVMESPSFGPMTPLPTPLAAQSHSHSSQLQVLWARNMEGHLPPINALLEEQMQDSGASSDFLIAAGGSRERRANKLWAALALRLGAVRKAAAVFMFKLRRAQARHARVSAREAEKLLRAASDESKSDGEDLLRLDHDFDEDSDDSDETEADDDEEGGRWAFVSPFSNAERENAVVSTAISLCSSYAREGTAAPAPLLRGVLRYRRDARAQSRVQGLDTLRDLFSLASVTDVGASGLGDSMRPAFRHGLSTLSGSAPCVQDVAMCLRRAMCPLSFDRRGMIITSEVTAFLGSQSVMPSPASIVSGNDEILLSAVTTMPEAIDTAVEIDPGGDNTLGETAAGRRNDAQNRNHASRRSSSDSRSVRRGRSPRAADFSVVAIEESKADEEEGDGGIGVRSSALTGAFTRRQSASSSGGPTLTIIGHDSLSSVDCKKGTIGPQHFLHNVSGAAPMLVSAVRFSFVALYTNLAALLARVYDNHQFVFDGRRLEHEPRTPERVTTTTDGSTRSGKTPICGSPSAPPVVPLTLLSSLSAMRKDEGTIDNAAHGARNREAAMPAVTREGIQTAGISGLRADRTPSSISLGRMPSANGSNLVALGLNAAAAAGASPPAASVGMAFGADEGRHRPSLVRHSSSSSDAGTGIRTDSAGDDESSVGSFVRDISGESAVSDTIVARPSSGIGTGRGIGAGIGIAQGLSISRPTSAIGTDMVGNQPEISDAAALLALAMNAPSRPESAAGGVPRRSDGQSSFSSSLSVALESAVSAPARRHKDSTNPKESPEMATDFASENAAVVESKSEYGHIRSLQGTQAPRRPKHVDHRCLQLCSSLLWCWALDFTPRDSEFLLRVGILPLLHRIVSIRMRIGHESKLWHQRANTPAQHGSDVFLGGQEGVGNHKKNVDAREDCEMAEKVAAGGEESIGAPITSSSASTEAGDSADNADEGPGIVPHTPSLGPRPVRFGAGGWKLFPLEDMRSALLARTITRLQLVEYMISAPPGAVPNTFWTERGLHDRANTQTGEGDAAAIGELTPPRDQAPSPLSFLPGALAAYAASATEDELLLTFEAFHEQLQQSHAGSVVANTDGHGLSMPEAMALGTAALSASTPVFRGMAGLPSSNSLTALDSFMITPPSSQGNLSRMGAPSFGDESEQAMASSVGGSSHMTSIGDEDAPPSLPVSVPTAAPTPTLGVSGILNARTAPPLPSTTTSAVADAGAVKDFAMERHLQRREVRRRRRRYAAAFTRARLHVRPQAHDESSTGQFRECTVALFRLLACMSLGGRRDPSLSSRVSAIAEAQRQREEHRQMHALRREEAMASNAESGSGASGASTPSATITIETACKVRAPAGVVPMWAEGSYDARVIADASSSSLPSFSTSTSALSTPTPSSTVSPQKSPPAGSGPIYSLRLQMNALCSVADELRVCADIFSKRLVSAVRMQREDANIFVRWVAADIAADARMFAAASSMDTADKAAKAEEADEADAEKKKILRTRPRWRDTVGLERTCYYNLAFFNALRRCRAGDIFIRSAKLITCMLELFAAGSPRIRCVATNILRDALPNVSPSWAARAALSAPAFMLFSAFEKRAPAGSGYEGVDIFNADAAVGSNAREPNRAKDEANAIVTSLLGDVGSAMCIRSIGLDACSKAAAIKAEFKTMSVREMLKEAEESGMKEVDSAVAGGAGRSDGDVGGESGSAAATSSRAQARREPKLEADTDVVMQLMAMGFSENGARRSAIAARNDVNAALNWALAHSGDANFNSPVEEATSDDSKSGWNDDGEDVIKALTRQLSIGEDDDETKVEEAVANCEVRQRLKMRSVTRMMATERRVATIARRRAHPSVFFASGYGAGYTRMCAAAEAVDLLRRLLTSSSKSWCEAVLQQIHAAIQSIPELAEALGTRGASSSSSPASLSSASPEEQKALCSRVALAAAALSVLGGSRETIRVGGRVRVLDLSTEEGGVSSLPSSNGSSGSTGTVLRFVRGESAVSVLFDGGSDIPAVVSVGAVIPMTCLAGAAVSAAYSYRGAAMSTALVSACTALLCAAREWEGRGTASSSSPSSSSATADDYALWRSQLLTRSMRALQCGLCGPMATTIATAALSVGGGRLITSLAEASLSPVALPTILSPHRIAFEVAVMQERLLEASGPAIISKSVPIELTRGANADNAFKTAATASEGDGEGGISLLAEERARGGFVAASGAVLPVDAPDPGQIRTREPSFAEVRRMKQAVRIACLHESGSIELACKALELKGDDVERAVGWLLSPESSAFVSGGGLQQADEGESEDPRWPKARNLAVSYGMSPQLLFRALELHDDNEQAAVNWCFDYGRQYEVAAISQEPATVSSDARNEEADVIRAIALSTAEARSSSGSAAAGGAAGTVAAGDEGGSFIDDGSNVDSSGFVRLTGGSSGDRDAMILGDLIAVDGEQPLIPPQVDGSRGSGGGHSNSDNGGNASRSAENADASSMTSAATSERGEAEIVLVPIRDLDAVRRLPLSNSEMSENEVTPPPFCAADSLLRGMAVTQTYETGAVATLRGRTGTIESVEPLSEGASEGDVRTVIVRFFDQRRGLTRRESVPTPYLRAHCSLFGRPIRGSGAAAELRSGIIASEGALTAMYARRMLLDLIHMHSVGAVVVSEQGNEHQTAGNEGGETKSGQGDGTGSIAVAGRNAFDSRAIALSNMLRDVAPTSEADERDGSEALLALLKLVAASEDIFSGDGEIGLGDGSSRSLDKRVSPRAGAYNAAMDICSSFDSSQGGGALGQRGRGASATFLLTASALTESARTGDSKRDDITALVARTRAYVRAGQGEGPGGSEASPMMAVLRRKLKQLLQSSDGTDANATGNVERQRAQSDSVSSSEPSTWSKRRKKTDLQRKAERKKRNKDRKSKVKGKGKGNWKGREKDKAKYDASRAPGSQRTEDGESVTNSEDGSSSQGSPSEHPSKLPIPAWITAGLARAKCANAISRVLTRECVNNLLHSTRPPAAPSNAQERIARTRESMHPYFPVSDYVGHIHVKGAKALWVVFDPRCASARPNTGQAGAASIHFYAPSNARRLLTLGLSRRQLLQVLGRPLAEAGGAPGSWRPFVVRGDTVFFRFTARGNAAAMLPRDLCWGYRMQARPLRGLSWECEEHSLREPCLEWACWLLEFLISEAQRDDRAHLKERSDGGTADENTRGGSSTSDLSSLSGADLLSRPASGTDSGSSSGSARGKPPKKTKFKRQKSLRATKSQSNPGGPLRAIRRAVYNEQVYLAMARYLHARGAPFKQRIVALLIQMLRRPELFCHDDSGSGESPEQPYRPDLQALSGIEGAIVRWCVAQEEAGRLFLPVGVQQLLELTTIARIASRVLIATDCEANAKDGGKQGSVGNGNDSVSGRDDEQFGGPPVQYVIAPPAFEHRSESVGGTYPEAKSFVERKVLHSQGLPQALVDVVDLTGWLQLIHCAGLDESRSTSNLTLASRSRARTQTRCTKSAVFLTRSLSVP